RVWTAARRWEPGHARFTAWLHRIAMNVCLDRIAKKRETVLDDLPELTDPRPEPSSALQARELSRHVRRAVAALPENQRTALVLCHYHGLLYSVADEALGVSDYVLMSLLTRVRHLCR